MTIRRSISFFTIALMAAAVVTVVSLLECDENKRQVRLHLGRLEDATYALFPATGKQAIGWRELRSRVSTAFSPIKDPSREMEKEREVLVELGYFEKRSFVLSNINSLTQLHAAALAAALKDDHWNYSTGRGTTVTVTAATVDMPRWEQVFSNLNRAATTPP